MAEMDEVMGLVRAALERYERGLDVLYLLATAGRRNATIDDTLRTIGEDVRSLRDTRLTALYDDLMRSVQASEAAQREAFEIYYAAFVERLLEVTSASSSELHTADVQLIATLRSRASSTLHEPPGPSLSA